MLAEDIQLRIASALAGAEVSVRDTTGTGDHFEALIVAEAFEGRTPVQRHQLVYAPLRDVLATGELHALALRTYTPAEWRAKGEKR